MLLKRKILLVKFLATVVYSEFVYSEEMYIKLLNLADNHYWQHYNELILLLHILDEVHFYHFYL